MPMRCMLKKTVETIVNSGNHYVIQVKRNQPNLLKEICRVSISQKPISYHHECDNSRGKENSWYVRVFDIEQNEKIKDWKNLRRVIHVHKKTYSYKLAKESHSDRYYISDLFQADAQKFHNGIRGHWKIENVLHWVKDVIHGEDKNKYRNNNAPVNVSTISTIVLNLHRKNGNSSITEGQIKFGVNIKSLFKLLRT